MSETTIMAGAVGFMLGVLFAYAVIRLVIWCNDAQ
jgi:hypothetical protein